MNQTLENLRLLRTLLPQLPVLLNFVNIAEDVITKRNVTIEQAEEVGKILYGWLQFTPATIKATATADEIEAWILGLENLINVGVAQWVLTQKLFVV